MKLFFCEIAGNRQKKQLFDKIQEPHILINTEIVKLFMLNIISQNNLKSLFNKTNV